MLFAASNSGSYMKKEEMLYLLALQSIPGVGDITAKKLITSCGGVEALFREKKNRLVKIDGIRETTINDLFDPKFLQEAEKEMALMDKLHINVLSYLDDNYPMRLKHCADGPVLLFTRGTMNLNAVRMISVVGTRQISRYGAEVCEKLIEGLASCQPTIISGFAYGVDICAHKTAIEHKLQTIGCLAHGLDKMYPASHKRYMQEMEACGGFITDFTSKAIPERANFLRRNRIIAGLSEATIVIESAEKGGSLVTANMAFHYNREVFAVPGRITDVYSKGCNNLIQNQIAHSLTDAKDLMNMLRWNPEDKKDKNIQKQLFVELEDPERKIYDYLQEKGKELFDIIALDCDLPVHKLSSILLNMEMKGVVRPLPGKLFETV